MPFWTRRRCCFLLCRSSDLSGVWLFRMRCRGAAFSASPGSAAPCFLSMYWGSFLLLRGFQRCRFGPAAGTFFLLCTSSDLSGVWLFRMHCRGATKHFPLAQVIWASFCPETNDFNVAILGCNVERGRTCVWTLVLIWSSFGQRANNFYVPLPCPIPHSLGVGGMGGSP